MTHKNRRPIHGIGINDADYVTQKTIDGKMVICKFYSTWRHMLERCYHKKYHDKKPTYKNCSVVDEWLSFMKFKEWMETQDWQGKSLDKDALIKGNRVYGPDTCVFIDSSTNSLFSEKVKPGKTLPFGVCVLRDKYHAQCNKNGRTVSLGLFDDPLEAHFQWKRAKAKSYAAAAMKQTDGRVMVALLDRAAKTLYGD